jgi:histidinol phosphatase-like enzyme
LGIDDIVVAYDRKSVDYKPNNGMIEKTLLKYNLNRDECILIGDTWKDIVAGFKSNLKTIYCNKEPFPAIVPEQYMDIFPDYYITTMSETMNILKDIK